MLDPRKLIYTSSDSSPVLSVYMHIIFFIIKLLI